MDGINSMSANGDGAIRIPGQLWLEHAKFVREGPDLLLIGQDGVKIHIADYFRTEPTPVLQSETGGTFSAQLVFKLAGPEAPGQFAQAAAGAVAQPIGRIETISGPVEITRADGTRVTVAKGDAVYAGDVIETGAKAVVSMVLADDSVFSLGDNGRIVLDEMVYDPSAQTGKLGMSLVTGVMSFVSGQIAKTDPDAMVLSTPIATVGIRGTTGSVSSGNTLTIVMSRDPDGKVGEIIVSTPSGGTQVIDSNFGGVNIGANGAIQTFTMTAEQFSRVFGQSLGELSRAITSAGLGNGLPDAGNNPPSSDTPPADHAELPPLQRTRPMSTRSISAPLSTATSAMSAPPPSRPTAIPTRGSKATATAWA